MNDDQNSTPTIAPAASGTAPLPAWLTPRTDGDSVGLVPTVAPVVVEPATSEAAVVLDVEAAATAPEPVISEPATIDSTPALADSTTIDPLMETVMPVVSEPAPVEIPLAVTSEPFAASDPVVAGFVTPETAASEPDVASPETPIASPPEAVDIPAQAIVVNPAEVTDQTADLVELPSPYRPYGSLSLEPEAVETASPAEEIAIDSQPAEIEVTPPVAAPVFTEATPIIPVDSPLAAAMAQNIPTQINQEPQDIMGNTTPFNPGIPTSPSDITPDMMASFLQQNNMNLENTLPVSNQAGNMDSSLSVIETTTKKKGSYIPIFVLALLVLVVGIVILLMLTGFSVTNGTQVTRTSSISATSTVSSSISSAAESDSSSSSVASVTSTESSAASSNSASYVAQIPAGWSKFTDGLIKLDFALPPQASYVEVIIPITPSTVTPAIKQEWLAKPSEWFYKPTETGPFLDTTLASKTITLSRAPGRSSGLSTICADSDYECHIDIKLEITRIDFDGAISDLVAKIKAANPTYTLNSSTTTNIWNAVTAKLTINIPTSIMESAQTLSYILIKKNDEIFSLKMLTKSAGFATELNTVINAVSILP